MFDLSSSTIEKVIIHKVGNKLRSEDLLLSDDITPASENINDILLRHYLKPIISKDNIYEFFHDIDINLNEVYHFTNEIFTTQTEFVEKSKNIATTLYNVSTHPNIAAGELIIILFNNIIFNNSSHYAIGLYKTEIKENYLDIKQENNSLIIKKKNGISINKLQKAALILDNNQIFAIDNLSQKTKYWHNNFLQIRLQKNSKNNAQIANKILKKVFLEIKNPVEAIELTNEITKKIEEEPKLFLEDIRDISKKYIIEDSFDEIIKNISKKEDIDLQLTDDINSEDLQKLNKAKKQKIKIINNIELIINSLDFTIDNMKLVESEEGTLVSFKISNIE
ncbi:hypothetical protein RMB03_07895 [Acinetobacter sp. V91_7]|jgi:hypothetical protein|uniref:hypothetical protein n=1 Tax=Acinetobacter TaxID=469 RepID=UPI00287BE39A|nr:MULTISPECIES: hypothetical protein [unclassified Acinetobacter]MDS7933060.1 hypothetical protein [Acinetobacter sp. V91_4B]MDS7962877.1 hypothetical protein [Acinetobacter sp. V91_7]MDS8026134.1 hypothetical protein [Acinetobacter sp. V91_13]